MDVVVHGCADVVERLRQPSQLIPGAHVNMDI